MCEYVSFLASDEGPTLQLYFSTGINSHANIRDAYKITSDGAECEWIGNNSDTLTVRHFDKDIAKLIKRMILDKYPTLKDMLQDIKSVRDRDGTDHKVAQDTYLTPEERKAATPGMLEKHKLWVETKGKEGVRVNFSWWDLSCAYLQGAYLQGANLQGADLRNALLKGAHLRGANLQDTDLQDANLRGADLQDANLRGANLRGANLRNANLRNANLDYADLQDANLRGANLRNANLRNANLRNANLDYADLQGANLQYARNVSDTINK
jgi:hypothetical protein